MQDAKKVMEDVSDCSKDTVNKLLEKGEKAVETFKAVSENLTCAVNYVRDIPAEIRRCVRRYPFQSMVTLAVVGFAAGFGLVALRRRDDRED